MGVKCTKDIFWSDKRRMKAGPRARPGPATLSPDGRLTGN